ncbi:hypothetical protein NFI96_001221 [Prochilodus magdalenae]|nr:hypothetical protein NFI96_001221 [Prochilodus magdalenae]
MRNHHKSASAGLNQPSKTLKTGQRCKPAEPLGFQQCQALQMDRMPAASIMTGGRALLLCTNTENCIYQTVNGFQCCGLQFVDAQSVVSQRPELCRVVDSQSPLTSLDNLDCCDLGKRCHLLAPHKRLSHPTDQAVLLDALKTRLGRCRPSTPRNPHRGQSEATARIKGQDSPNEERPQTENTMDPHHADQLTSKKRPEKCETVRKMLKLQRYKREMHQFFKRRYCRRDHDGEDRD